MRPRHPRSVPLLRGRRGARRGDPGRGTHPAARGAGGRGRRLLRGLVGRSSRLRRRPRRERRPAAGPQPPGRRGGTGGEPRVPGGAPADLPAGCGPAGPSRSRCPVGTAPATARRGAAGGEVEALVEVLWQLGLRTLGRLRRPPRGRRAGPLRRRRRPPPPRGPRCSRTARSTPVPHPPTWPPCWRSTRPPNGSTRPPSPPRPWPTGSTGDLSARGLACTRVVIEAETCHGEMLRRLWRHEGVLQAAALADRTRWQLEGWLAGTAAERPTGGLSRLALAPRRGGPGPGPPARLLGRRDARGRAGGPGRGPGGRHVGAEAVTVPERRGGRRPDDQFELVPVAAVDLTERGPLAAPEAPWPGRLPVAPAVVQTDRSLPVEVLDAGGAPVTVTGRGIVSAPPARVDGVDVVAWAGPWPLLERWWDPAAARRQARFQVVTSDDQAQLLVVEGGQVVVGRPLRLTARSTVSRRPRPSRPSAGPVSDRRSHRDHSGRTGVSARRRTPADDAGAASPRHRRRARPAPDAGTLRNCRPKLVLPSSWFRYSVIARPDRDPRDPRRVRPMAFELPPLPYRLRRAGADHRRRDDARPPRPAPRHLRQERQRRRWRARASWPAARPRT